MQPPRPTAQSAYPMAPTESEWAQLSAAERARVVEALPASMTDAEASPPEGDLHYDGKNDVRETARGLFALRGADVYGLDLVLESGWLRFYPATAELLAPRDLAAKLELLVEEVRQHAEARLEVEAERARAEAERARAETERARVETERADALAAELAELRAEIERLRHRE